MDALNGGGMYRFNIGDAVIELSSDDVLSTQTSKEGFAAESDYNLTVVLDTTITPKLYDEGLLRELVSKVQAFRKKIGLEVTDHICLGVDGDEKIIKVCNRFMSELSPDVLADSVEAPAEFGETETNDINGLKAVISIRKA